MKFLAEQQGVYAAVFDFCMLGMETETDDGEKRAAKKRTKVLTNSVAVATLLREAQCDGQHEHEHLLNGRASACQEYPENFVQASVRGRQAGARHC